MTELTYATRQTFNAATDAVDIAYNFSELINICLIDLDSPQKRSTWNKAGNIIQTVQLPFISVHAEVSNSYSFLGFEPTLIRFTPLAQNWRLRFKPVPWLTEFTITIYQGTETTSDTFILGI